MKDNENELSWGLNIQYDGRDIFQQLADIGRGKPRKKTRQEEWEEFSRKYICERVASIINEQHERDANGENSSVLKGSVSYDNVPNNNHLSLKDMYSEFYNLSERKMQKKAIDDYLNAYVEKNNIPNEYKNALRHRAGSLLMAQNLKDNDKAQLWGNLKEFGDLLSGHDNKIGSAIDAQNNFIGRSLYNKYKNDNLTNDRLMDKVINSIKVYNPDETNYIDFETKDSKIPLRKTFNFINTFTNPLNKAYHFMIELTKRNHMK